MSTCIDQDGKLWAWANYDFDQQDEQQRELGSMKLSIHPEKYEPLKFKHIQQVALGGNFMLVVSQDQPLLPKPKPKAVYGTRLRTKIEKENRQA